MNISDERAIKLYIGDVFWVNADQIDSKHTKYRVGDFFTAEIYNGMLTPFSLVYPPENSTVCGTFLLRDIAYKRRRWFELFKVRMPSSCMFQVIDNQTKIS